MATYKHKSERSQKGMRLDSMAIQHGEVVSHRSLDIWALILYDECFVWYKLCRKCYASEVLIQHIVVSGMILFCG